MRQPGPPVRQPARPDRSRPAPVARPVSGGGRDIRERAPRSPGCCGTGRHNCQPANPHWRIIGAQANPCAMPNRMLPMLALGLGALAALGFAPLDLWPATLVAVAGLIWIVMASAGWGTAALSGLAFGTSMSLISLNWIAQSFAYQAKMPAVLGWVTVAGLALFLALYVAIPAGLAALATRPVSRMLLFIALWLPAEWLRGVLFTGFAWNPLGIVWLGAPGVHQWAAEIGGIGLSAVLLLAASGLVWMAIGPAMLHRLLGGGVVAAVAVAGWVGDSRVVQSGFLGPPILVIQPGIGQDERYDPAAAARHLTTYLNLTRDALKRADETQRAELPDVTIKEANIERAPEIDSPLRPSTSKVTGQIENTLAAGLGDSNAIQTQQQQNNPVTGRRAGETVPALVLWPEGAIDDLLEQDSALRARLAAVLRPGDVLVTGGAGYNPKTPATPYSNSLFVLDNQGRILSRYDKAHLVPLGEYVPARSLLEPLGVARLVPGGSDFAAGPGPRTLVMPGRFLGMSPVICYEIAFPGAVVDEANRPAWIANISNDAWFGAWGPPQHLAQARLRAIEEGLPVIRATTNGTSAVIDGYGRLLARSLGNGPETLVVTLPPPLPQPAFPRGGALVTMLFAIFLGAVAAFLQRFRHIGINADQI
ncbi:apolipoprotein N-acyltransferase [Sandarakinorhabdus cyanobacteriorum]|uniref:Apolipoprotein N-acyltransferase n=2 Tax=Sandarakinorhabdus cyanobacteriorum TaxID=1981098 RepID=A0A255YL99_9SPHN|nr:apolipoprotein N-acyltransferase [Sandarakinorhabdus cyanobacteriorum]